MVMGDNLWWRGCCLRWVSSPTCLANYWAILIEHRLGGLGMGLVLERETAGGEAACLGG